MGHGAAIYYDGSYTPDPGPDHFNYALFSNNWFSDGDVLSINTSYATGGIWFGWHHDHGNSYWSLGSDTQGTYVNVRAMLTPGSTEWSIYLYDGSYLASFYLLGDRFQYIVPDTGGGITANIYANMNVYRNYEFWIKDGMVAYAVDGTVWYAGPAYAASTNRYLIIGDGSGSDISGTGTMKIDYATILTASDFASAPAMPLVATVPEPESFALCGLGLGVATLGRRLIRR